MFCLKCGTQNPDNSKYCQKCGYPIGIPASDVADYKIKEPARKPNQNKLKPILTCVCLVAVMGLFVTVFKTITSRITNNNGDHVSGGFTGNNHSDYIDDRTFSLDAINEQCGGCREALTTYIGLVNNGDTVNSTKDSINDYSYKKYYEMQHNCSADVIHVQNIPYAYYGSYGTYTGEWKGAGPSGYGKYTGSVYRKYAVTYEGDWAYGLPNGNGELYVENYIFGWDMTYKGQMADGMRNGTGHLYEYYPDEDHSKYRIYDETSFQNDIMAKTTDCAEYDAKTGEIMRFFRMEGDSDTKWVNMVDSWEANELNPEQKKALEFAECALVIGTVAYMVSPIFDSSGGYDYDKANENMLNELNNYREQKAQDEQETLLNQQKEEESYRQYCTDKYEQLHKQDPSDWSLDAQYFKSYAY